MQDDEAVVYDVCMELSTAHVLSDATFARARSALTDQQIVDLDRRQRHLRDDRDAAERGAGARARRTAAARSDPLSVGTRNRATDASQKGT